MHRTCIAAFLVIGAHIGGSVLAEPGRERIVEFDPPKRCISRVLDGEDVVQACIRNIGKAHTLAVELRVLPLYTPEGKPPVYTSQADMKKIIDSAAHIAVAQQKLLAGLLQGLLADVPDELGLRTLESRSEKIPSPFQGAFCQKYWHFIRDTQVPGHEDTVFDFRQSGLACTYHPTEKPGAARYEPIYAIILTVGERYSDKLGHEPLKDFPQIVDSTINSVHILD